MVFVDIDSAIANLLWSATVLSVCVCERNWNESTKHATWMSQFWTYADPRCRWTLLLCRITCIGMQCRFFLPLTTEFNQRDSFGNGLTYDSGQHHLFHFFHWLRVGWWIRFRDGQLFWRFAEKRQKWQFWPAHLRRKESILLLLWMVYALCTLRVHTHNTHFDRMNGSVTRKFFVQSSLSSFRSIPKFFFFGRMVARNNEKIEPK